ncbi:MAG: PAS domain S-box protein [Methylobacter sp.]|nr:PAS domain S-box protein [Methylobacter sp.]
MTNKAPLILIIDDQSAILEALSASLNSRNFRTALARDGQQGLHYAGLLRPDLVLLDIALPDMDGNEVCRSLKVNRETHAIPVIFMITPDDGDKLLAGFEAGGIDYLIKPLQIEDMITRLNLRLKLHGLQQAKTQDTDLNKRRSQIEICNNEYCEEVMERKRAEQRLLEQKGQIGFMSFILDRLHEAIFLVNPQAGFRFCYVNDKACQSLGYTRDELLSMCVPDIDPYVDLVTARKFNEQIRKQTPARLETLHRRKNGHQFPVELSGTEIEYNGQTMELSIVRDITERKHMEELLRMKEFALDHASDAIFLIDPNERFVYINEEACRALGYSRDELIGLTPFDIAPDVTAESYQSNHEQILAEGSNTLKTRHRRRDGSVFPVEIRCSRFDFQGQALTMALARDITERSRMEAEAQNHLRFFENMDRVNRAIQGSNDLETALNNMLDTVLAIFDCDRAFLCYPCDPEADSWNVPFERTRPEYPGALALSLVMPMDEGKSAELRMLLETVGPVTFGPGNQYPLPKEVSKKFGIKSLISLAVYPKGNKPWHVGIQQCSRTRVWTADEQKLFQEIGRRLADFLTGLLAFRDIQEREQQFRTLAENLPDNIVRYNREGVTVYVNPELERTLGGMAASMIGTIPREYHSDRSYEDYAQVLDAVLASGEARELEKTVPGPNGSTSTHHIRIVPEHGENGEVIGALTISRDITERKRMEAELVGQAEFQQTLLNAMYEVGMQLMVIENGKIIHIGNRKNLIKLGLPEEALDGRLSLIDIIHPDERARVMDYHRRRLAGETVPTTYELGLVTRDGKRREYETSVAVVPGTDPVRVVSIGREITGQVRLRETLAAREREFRTLAENSPDSIIRYDSNCRRTYVNRAYEIATNTQRADIVGKTPLDDWHLTTPNAYEYTKLLQRVIATGKAERFETQLFGADDSSHYFSMQFVPEYDEQNQVNGVLAFGTDITELKTAERRRVEASKQAEHQLREFSAHLQAVREKEKTSFAREIHDNLGGTLTALKMDLNWLMDELSEIEEAKSLLEHIELMSQLLDNAAVATRQVITDLRPTLLDDFGLSAALEWQAEQFHKRTGIQCRVACDESSPYELDKSQTTNLYRIFQESLTNVARHSSASMVEVVLQHDNAAFILTISDNGCGLPEEHIIAPTSYGMLGMRERTEQLGGRINFYSPPGGGFSVTVMLPQTTDNKNEGKS